MLWCIGALTKQQLSGVSKLMNSTQSVCCEAFVNGCYYMFVFHYTNHVQSLRGAKASCYVRAAFQFSARSERIARMYKSERRICATDKEGAVDLAERAFDGIRPRSTNMRIKCRVHHKSGNRNKVFGLPFLEYH